MKNGRFVINTLVCLDEIKDGATQLQLLKPLSELDVHAVEVRREFIRDENEFEKMKREGESLGVDLFYSVPDGLFDNGEINMAHVQRYFMEAEKLGAKMVKFNLGDFRGFSVQDMKALNKVLGSDPMVVTVENDQTVVNGTVNNLLPFLIECEQKGIPIHTTFDIGNWYWVGEDPINNVEKLAPYIKYIHLKDVQMIENRPQTVRLGKGVVPWHNILSLLSYNIPVALEYPCGRYPYEVVKNEISLLSQFQ